MPRSGEVKKRIVNEDPVYKNRTVTKLINRVMKDGKKSVAQKQVYAAIESLGKKANEDPVVAFTRALENIKPTVEVRSRRIGGAAYQVPVTVRGNRRESLAIRWLILAAQARPSTEFHTFGEKLAAELHDALNNIGGAIKKKEDTHRMADANKAFAHFRW